MTYLKNGWYCAALSEEIGTRPSARRLLDLPVLLVRDSQGAVRAMSDMCPHRFAPLHKGVPDGDSVTCPYHGLRFDFNGNCTHNPHGDGGIPASAKLRTYPVVERHSVIWFWPGDPALADPNVIPDLRLFPTMVSGHLQMPLDYRLIIDNLLDLSHAPFLHGNTISPVGKREAKFDVTDDAINCHYLMRDVATPAVQTAVYDKPRGDFYSEIEWVAPTNLRQRVAMVEAGAPADDGANMRAAHLITPETATSSHYFWLTSRNRRTDDLALNEVIRTLAEKAFTTEDEPMIEACQNYMDGHEFFSLKPVYLQTDYAGTRCRRILEKLIASERAGPVADAIYKTQPDEAEQPLATS